MAKWWPFGKKETARKPKRSYAGAAVNRIVADWVTSNTSADAEIRNSLRRLRDRSRQMARDNEWAKNTIRSLANNVVGEGVRLQSQVKQLRGSKLDQKVNDQIEKVWCKWKKKQNCDTRGMMSFEDIEAILIRSIAESGEVFVRKIKQSMGDLSIPFTLEIIESDQLDDMYFENLPDGGTIKMGVERNKWQRPVAYHFFQAHPGDFINSTYKTTQRMRIPAEEILHLFPMDRIGQTRGVPLLAATLMRLHQMGGYEEAEIINARASAALMGFIESPTGEVPYDGIEDGERVSEFEPGVIKYLAEGEKFTQTKNDHPAGQFEPFVRSMLRGVAAGVGVSYETISKDYSQSNYSSTRQALLEDRVNYRIIQQWLIRNFHEPIYSEWLDYAILSGEIKLKTYEGNEDAYKACRWLPRGWSWIDPLKDVQANISAVRAGFKTISEVVAENGGDVEEMFSQRARELELAKEYDLILDTDPSKVNDKGAIQAPAGGNANPQDNTPAGGANV